MPLYRFPQFFLDFLKMSVVLTLSYFVITGRAQMGDVVSASIAFGILDKYFQGLVDSFQSFADEQTNYRRLREYLDGMDEFRRYREGAPFIPGKGDLSFEGRGREPICTIAGQRLRPDAVVHDDGDRGAAATVRLARCAGG